MQDDQHFDNERDAEEECDAAHAGIAAALFECLVIQSVGGKAEEEEERRDQKPRQKRVDIKAIVEEKHAVGGHYQKGRMRHMGNVEQAERDRQPEAHGRIEAAEQHTEHHGIEQQFH